MITIWWRRTLLLPAILALTTGAGAQVIRHIDTSRPELAALLTVKVGDVLTEDATAASIRNLFATGYFSDIRMLRKDNPDGTVDLKVETIPRILFGSVRWTTPLPVKKKRIVKFLRNTYPLGKPFDFDRYEQFIEQLRSYLNDLGFPDAKITHFLEFPESGNRAHPSIGITSGKPIIIRSLACNATGKWQRILKLKPGDRLNREQLTHDIRRLRRDLIRRGYFDADVTDRIQIERHMADITVTVHTGPKYDVIIEGVERTPERMDTVLTELKKSGATDTALQIARNNLYFHLLASGFVEPQVNVEKEAERIRFRVQTKPRQPVKSLVVRSKIPISLETPAFFNLLTKSNLSDTVSATLAKEGYLQPDVSFNYNSIAERLEVSVNPGRQWKIGTIEFSGDTNALSRIPGIATGNIYSPEAIRKALAQARTALQAKGWYDPQIEVTRGQEQNGQVPLAIHVTTGGRRTLRSILIDGNRRIRLSSIQHMLGRQTGDPVTAADFRAMRERLEASGFFSDVTLTAMETGPGESALYVKLDEQPLTGYRYGIGFNSDEGLRASASLTRNYLFHQEISATLLTRISARRQQFYLNFSGRSRFMGSLFAFFEDQTDYNYSRYGGSISYSAEPGPRLNMLSSLEWRRNRLFDLTVPLEEINEKDLHPTSVVSVNNQLLYDRRNDPLYPESGYYLSLRIEPSWDLSAGRFYLKYMEKTAFFFGRLALSQTFGHIAAPKNGYEVPVPERLFTGGTNTLRISSWYRAGPTFSTGVPTGGRVLALFNAEYRFPLKHNLEGTLFLDLGNVWSFPSDMSWNSAIKDAGLGIRAHTPMGPVRVELAYNLDRKAFPSRWKLIFSIGNTF